MPNVGTVRHSAEAMLSRSCSLLRGVAITKHTDDCSTCGMFRHNLNRTETAEGIAEVLRSWYSYASCFGSGSDEAGKEC